jgi:hypothetical protein
MSTAELIANRFSESIKLSHLRGIAANVRMRSECERSIASVEDTLGEGDLIVVQADRSAPGDSRFRLLRLSGRTVEAAFDLAVDGAAKRVPEVEIQQHGEVRIRDVLEPKAFVPTPGHRGHGAYLRDRLARRRRTADGSAKH